MLRTLLEHPLTRGLEVDDPRTTLLRRRIIQEKTFLRRVYQEWYSLILSALPDGDGPVLELGSGPGFLERFLPDVITSEVFFCPTVRVVTDGCALPFSSQSLRSLVMVDVLHHIPRPRDFFVESARCVRGGGRVVMIEPWVTRWSQFVCKQLHHEPFCPRAQDWEFPASGPLSGANSALPWIIFERDVEIFEKEFPQWVVEKIEVTMPLRYLLSGGVSSRASMPGWSFRFWKTLELFLRPWNDKLGMFAKIVLLRTG
jgi:SAM-dependent methyltransferase